jgi:hypothetical protein
VNNYRVTFFKLSKEESEKKGQYIVTDQQCLGSIVIDDHGTGKDLSLTAKAFRHAPSTYLYADKVIVEKL